MNQLIWLSGYPIIYPLFLQMAIDVNTRKIAGRIPVVQGFSLQVFWHCAMFKFRQSMVNVDLKVAKIVCRKMETSV